MNGKMVRIGNVIRRAFRRVFLLEALIKTFKQLTYKQVIFYSLILLSVIISLVFVYNNYAFYDRPIAKVIETHTEETTDVTDQYGNEDTITIQNITDRKSTRLNSSHVAISYAVFCLKKKTT